MADNTPGNGDVIESSSAGAGQDVERWMLASILGSSMAFIDGTVVNGALPTLQEVLGATAAEVQWVVESYARVMAALLLLGGAVGDKVGRRRVFAIGAGLFAAASSACALAPFLISDRAQNRHPGSDRGRVCGRLPVGNAALRGACCRGRVMRVVAHSAKDGR